jgi:glycosyltransferase involved in cell wall biosynthesis
MHTRDEDIFAYVRSEARETQRQYEHVLTAHLRKVNALLPPRTEPYLDTRQYPVKATVVIPVRNRERTIKDAVKSALSQTTTFPFNVVVVDNYSTDRTPHEALKAADGDGRVHIMTPPSEDFGIGGCWNFAAACSEAGRYLVQLDSDDVYATAESVQILVDLIDRGPWAMAVGSYRTVDIADDEVPPGDVTHDEWTDENGHNNLLRVSGIGAPRVLATGFLREHAMPNVSYGEDYAAALRVSRTHHIARHFGIVYYARRWEGNSEFDVEPSVARSREVYKDQLRTIELQARTALLRDSHDHLG